MSDDDDEETFDDVTEVHRFFRPLMVHHFVGIGKKIARYVAKNVWKYNK